MALKDFHFFCVTFRNENTGINEVASTTTIFFPNGEFMKLTLKLCSSEYLKSNLQAK